MGYFIYLMGNFKHEWFKIGITGNPDRRWQEFQNLPFQVSLLAVVECKSKETAAKVEAALHEHYASIRIAGEWFGYINSADFLKQVHGRI